MCRWHSRFPFTEVLWIFNLVMFMWHLHREVRTAWKCLSDCEYDKLLSQRLSGRYAPDCGTSMRHHVLEKPRESPPWPCLLDMLVTCRTQSRWLSVSKVTLEPHPFWMLTLIKRSPSHTLAASTETVKLLSAETMEGVLMYNLFFIPFYWNCLILIRFVSITLTKKPQGSSKTFSVYDISMRLQFWQKAMFLLKPALVGSGVHPNNWSCLFEYYILL